MNMKEFSFIHLLIVGGVYELATAAHPGFEVS